MCCCRSAFGNGSISIAIVSLATVCKVKTGMVQVKKSGSTFMLCGFTDDILCFIFYAVKAPPEQKQLTPDSFSRMGATTNSIGCFVSIRSFLF